MVELFDDFLASRGSRLFRFIDMETYMYEHVS